MKKNYIDKVNRKAFIQLSIESPKEGAKHLEKLSKKMAKCNKTCDVIDCLKELLFISQATIYNDLELY